MWYTISDVNRRFRLCYATSNDGIVWEPYENNPVLDLGAPGEWDDYHVGYQFVLFEDGTYKMWYPGTDGSNWRIGYATSRATIDIRTDKMTYHEGDRLRVYADVVNIDRDVPDAVLALYLITPTRASRVKIIPFDMPPDYEVRNWRVYVMLSVPALPFKTYAYLGVLADQSDGIINADITFWTFSTILSGRDAARLSQVAEEYLQNLTVADLIRGY